SRCSSGAWHQWHRGKESLPLPVLNFELRQPQKEMSVMVGETLTLTCTVSEGRPVGPVRTPHPWVRAVDGSNTDFTILIRDVRPEDAGTYYCVKFRKTHTGDELYRRGEGTVVSVHTGAPARIAPSTPASGELPSDAQPRRGLRSQHQGRKQRLS
uniref:Ig-like domain-containing protein n=1 Tax=Anser cygnoides TaxID=8845 RepID=A0A8B9EF63_ANSCY